jgi:hypothetical protein
MVTMVIHAAERFACHHELVGLPGFFRCANCPFQVSELPLSKKSGATVLNATFSGGEDSGNVSYRLVELATLFAPTCLCISYSSL